MSASLMPYGDGTFHSGQAQTNFKTMAPFVKNQDGIFNGEFKKWAWAATGNPPILVGGTIQKWR
jgi:hypothetical protein